MAKKDIDITKLMKEQDKIRNIGIVAHIDHGKTTLSDNILAGAGMLSEDLAGQQLYLDFDEQESARGITINAANVSIVHEFEEVGYLVNLIDTPGHVDFGGDVTRAMRAVDGAIVVACAVEGVMPQTETVLRQALKERVQPVLFINKVDRMIKELKLTPQQMQEKFTKIIAEVNNLIESKAPDEFKQKWKVNVNDGSVAFGSAYHNWGLSIPFMKKKGVTFNDIFEAYEKGDRKPLQKKAPIYEVFLDMVVKHLPNPVEAQKYRIPRLWRGDINSPLGKSLLNCDQKGDPVFLITKITVDPKAGEIATGRIFSGEIKEGMELYSNRRKLKQRIQQVSIYRGPKRVIVPVVPAGNIIGVVGLKDAISGETMSKEEITSFEQIKHLFEPVVTEAIEAKNPKELPKLIEVLKNIVKEDPTISVDINEQTGENLISGLGELHLEIWKYRIIKDKGIEIVSSNPIVVYRESIKKHGGPVEGKSPNKHNKLYVEIEPLEQSVYDAIKEGEIPEVKIKKRKPEIEEALVNAGMDKEEARKVKDIKGGCVLVDATRGIVHIGEIIELVIDAFEEIVKAGPIAREPCMKLKVKLMDCKLHEDSIHRGPAQIIPAMRMSMKGAIEQGGEELYEPKQIIRIDAPNEYFGDLTKIISSKRGQLIDTEQEGENMLIKAKLPVAEMLGFTNTLRSATEGRGSHSLIDQKFEPLPASLQIEVVNKIRERKGLKGDTAEE
ncbi:MAG: elongation factor EF-2 [Candidatus Woesearchaeota archaeon]|nr:MAG: elongation factor EF-2 [Candidatus Woesearchaeota archaeon]